LPVFERLDDERAVARRRQIYHEIAEAMPKLTERQVAVIEAVSNDFNFVGYLVTRELIEFELIADLYVDPVIRCWTVCEPFIREQQAVRSPLYGTHFYEFYKQCLRHRGTAQTDRASTTGAIDQPGFADGPAADPATRHD
jgi:hypothetical protein